MEMISRWRFSVNRFDFAILKNNKNGIRFITCMFISEYRYFIAYWHIGILDGRQDWFRAKTRKEEKKKENLPESPAAR